ncbi:WD repeat-containing protein 76 [Bulinus truncatus]|nr:WD repeat-containing protein 76 [Bulinus truncatus]
MRRSERILKHLNDDSNVNINYATRSVKKKTSDTLTEVKLQRNLRSSDTYKRKLSEDNLAVNNKHIKSEKHSSVLSSSSKDNLDPIKIETKEALKSSCSSQVSTIKIIKSEDKNIFDSRSKSNSDNLQSENTDSDEILDYQKLREQNLRANQELFASLGFVNLKTSLKTSQQKIKPSRRGLNMTKELKNMNPRRSLRIQCIDPQGAPLPKPDPDPISDIAEQRLPPGPVTFIDVIYSNKKEYTSKEIDTFSSLVCKLITIKPSQAYLYKDFVSRLQKANISENRVAKVVPGRVFSLAWHPSHVKLISIAGDKYGHIGFWDVTKQDSDDLVTAFKPHIKPVSHLAISPLMSHKLYSCSYDATLRCGDFEKGVFDEIFSVPEEHGDLFRNFDFVDSDNTMLVSQYSGNVSLIDTRTPTTSAEHVYQVSSKSLRSVSVNPVHSHHFITAGNDAYINLWDLRFIRHKSPKPIQMIHNHSKSVTCAYFSPNGHKILSSSTDNTILVHEMNEAVKVELTKRIQHNNNTGRWLTNFQPKWHPNVEDVFVSGSMKYPREIEVFHSNGTVLKALKNEDHLSSVCSLNVFHPNMICTLVGANSSGRLFVFM